MVDVAWAPTGRWTGKAVHDGQVDPFTMDFDEGGTVALDSDDSTGAGTWTATGAETFSFLIKEEFKRDESGALPAKVLPGASYIMIDVDARRDGTGFAGSGNALIHAVDGTVVHSTEVTITARQAAAEGSQAEATGRLTSLLFGFFPAQVTSTVARLGIPDLLAQGPQSAADIAQSTGADERSLQRLLRAAVGLELLDLTPDGRFALTGAASLLRTGVPGSLRATAAMFTSERYWRSWGELETAVRTGKTAFDSIFGMSYFEYLDQNPAQRAALLNSLADGNRRAAADIAENCELFGLKTVADIGGGDGVVLTVLLNRYPDLTGTLLDLPTNVGFAEQQLSESGLAERSTVMAGDFFAKVPGGHDAYVLKNVLHDWDDKNCVAILANIRAAIPAHGKLLVIELVIPEDPDGLKRELSALMIDHMMLVCLGGLERTEAEFRSLLGEAGFRLDSVGKPMGTGGGVPMLRVLTARPA
jgi:hypothetical protein